MDVDHYLPAVCTADFPQSAFVITAGQRVRIDRVDCIIVSIGPDGITTRPVTDAD